ncbi:MAG: hypothetical protein Q8O43_07510 [Dehalococcoidia bacterium]|nr:hypothetical protein [Dehalococcoidia bacterium]
MDKIFQVAVDFPGTVFYAAVVGIGLCSWVVVWSSERRIKRRDRHLKDPEHDEPDSPCHRES